MARVCFVGDLHHPFAHPNALLFVEKIYYEWKCTEIIFSGDEVDAHAISKFDPDPDGFSPGMELALAIDALQHWYRAFPKAKICTSNHTERYYKAAFAARLPRAFLKSYNEFLKAPDGWTWADHWEVDGVRYFHGSGFSGQNGHTMAARSFRQSVAMGHLHSHAAVSWMQGPKDRIFAMNVGALIDEQAYAFKYSKHLASRCCHGVGVIIDGVEPYWVPMSEKLKRIKS